MTVGIINLLEMVEIDHDDAESTAAKDRGLELSLELRKDGPSVSGPGKFVVGRMDSAAIVALSAASLSAAV